MTALRSTSTSPFVQTLSRLHSLLLLQSGTLADQLTKLRDLDPDLCRDLGRPPRGLLTGFPLKPLRSLRSDSAASVVQAMPPRSFSEPRGRSPFRTLFLTAFGGTPILSASLVENRPSASVRAYRPLMSKLP